MIEQRFLLIHYEFLCVRGKFENSEIHKLYHNELVEIVFQNADFTYKKSNDIFVLKNLDLQIKKGEFIALTGYSGCGKSTLFKLLMCLYKLDSGKILLLKNVYVQTRGNYCNHSFFLCKNYDKSNVL